MALVRTDVSNERIASIIKVERIVGLGTTLALASNGCALRSVLHFVVAANFVPSSLVIFTLIMDKIHSCETWVLTRDT
jgi:hypothetical protein